MLYIWPTCGQQSVYAMYAFNLHSGHIPAIHSICMYAACAKPCAKHSGTQDLSTALSAVLGQPADDVNKIEEDIAHLPASDTSLSTNCVQPGSHVNVTSSGDEGADSTSESSSSSSSSSSCSSSSSDKVFCTL